MNIYKGELFNDVINSDKLVLVDFFAPWCGPCQALLPVVTEVADSELKGIAKVYAVSIDDYRELALLSAVRSIPTLVLFKDGKEIDRKVGLLSRDELVGWVTSFK